MLLFVTKQTILFSVHIASAGKCQIQIAVTLEICDMNLCSDRLTIRPMSVR